MMSVLEKSRDAAGLSQRTVSRKLKRPINFSHLVEAGQRNLSVCEFIDYAKAIGADPVELLRQMIEETSSGR